MSIKENFDKIQKHLNLSRRSFLKDTAAGAGVLASSGLVELKYGKEAKAHAYAPYPKDDELETIVTSCAHNCGSRHMLVAHKYKDVIVRLSSDDGRYQKNGFYGKDTNEEPQLRACLRGRSYRQRLYSAERLL
ncbi:MAG: twin-arginine translocation signal domain-containing protein, partial [Gammaproteobacteria bacterium]|nr:twin-arginine translocation signal domain-containing protein [Gammaproteobacteria bacterium]